MDIKRVAIDLAKNIFQVSLCNLFNQAYQVLSNKKITRRKRR